MIFSIKLKLLGNDKPKAQNRFCDASIKGIRSILEDKYKFFS